MSTDVINDSILDDEKSSKIECVNGTKSCLTYALTSARSWTSSNSSPSPFFLMM